MSEPRIGSVLGELASKVLLIERPGADMCIAGANEAELVRVEALIFTKKLSFDLTGIMPTKVYNYI